MSTAAAYIDTLASPDAPGAPTRTIPLRHPAGEYGSPLARATVQTAHPLDSNPSRRGPSRGDTEPRQHKPYPRKAWRRLSRASQQPATADTSS
jgi:hypothetical protein